MAFMRDSKRLAFRAPADLLQQVQILAARDCCGVGQTIRRLLANAVRRELPKPKK